MTNKKTALLALIASAATAATLLLSTPAQAGGNISIPLPPLPPIPQIKLSAPPLMVWLPEPAVYVAMDSPYPIFCHESRYYLHSNNGWYVGPGYAGPWASIHVDFLPPGLRHYRGHEWGHYQHEARYWRHHEHHERPHFYGMHRHEYREAHAPRYYRDDDHRPQYEHRNHRQEDRHVYLQTPPRKFDRDHARGESSGHGYRGGYASSYARPNKHEIARAQYRDENRGRGHDHRRMSY